VKCSAAAVVAAADERFGDRGFDHQMFWIAAMEKRRRLPGASLESRNGVRMQIQSSRFGWLSVEDSRIMTFPRGLLGFPTHKRFALIQANSENYFFWLQSIDDPTRAFVVTDPGIFFKDYEVPVREETVVELELDEPEFLQTFTICNRVGEWLTGNLLGPLLVNSKNQLATQVVLTEKKWSTRQPLIKLEAQMPLAKSA
jgi:flagellar assembly factor FliW